MEKIYLDNAATTPLRQAVVVKMQDVLMNCYGNPSSSHAFGRSAKTMIEQARKNIARTLGASPGEIIFTSGGTEADNMILRGAVRDLKVKTIITAATEHHAVLHTAQALKEECGIELVFVNLDREGNPDLEHLQELLKNTPDQKLVSLMHVNNEIGNLLPIQKVAVLCKAEGAYFHSDTVQSVGHFPWDLREIPVDFIAAAAHKFHGPKGVGFAFIRKNTGLSPWILGGSQERGLRAGTEPFHNIVGMEAAFTEAYEKLEEERAYVQGLKAYFMERIKAELPGVAFNGASGHLERSTYTLVNVRLPFTAQQGQMLLFHLDLKGIACSKGSACQSGSNAGSHVLSAILEGEALEQPSVRFSFSPFNTREELDYVVEVLKEFAAV